MQAKRILQPEEFSGGEGPGQANFVLRKLGFAVGKKGEKVSVDAQGGKDWSDEEVRLIVADYYDMLQKEMLGKKYSKAELRRVILPQLQGRSEGSVEFKHQNVSAVLVNMGLAYVGG